MTTDDNVFLCLCTQMQEDQRRPAPPAESIFVSIPSYRDTRCTDTVASLFSAADRPHLVFVGVFEQVHPRKPRERCQVPPAHVHQVSVDTVHYSEAKGPLWARQRVCEMYNGEAYFLMIDAHTTFVSHWDAVLKAQIMSLRLHHNVPRPVLSGYAPATRVTRRETTVNHVHHICAARRAPHRNYPDKVLSVRKPSDGSFRRSAYVSGNFLFAHGGFCDAMRQQLAGQGHLFAHVFWGEEPLLSAVAFAHDYTVHTAALIPLTTVYEPKTLFGTKRNWRTDVKQLQRDAHAQRRASENRLQALLHTQSTDLNNRSMHEFYALAGQPVDPASLLVNNRWATKKTCTEPTRMHYKIK